MKKFLLKVALIAFLFIGALALLVTVSSFVVKSRNFKNFETESNLLILEEGKAYDVAFLGISHARNFSRHKNHLLIENTLHKKVLNLGQGYATCGVNDQLFYLKYFYSKNVKIDTVIYVLSPPLLYGNYLNQASSTFNLEPFRIDFFLQYCNYPIGENKDQRLFQYVSSKLHPKWLLHFPETSDKKEEKLLALDTAVVNKGFKMAYLEGENLNIFKKNCDIVELTIREAKKHNTAVVFIIPPALFGKWKGHEETMAFCKNMQTKYNTGYYDFSESILEPQYYYDHHHLNTEGVKYFTENSLAPIFHQ